MPELIRSVVSRARMYFKDRRRSPRLRIRVAFSLSVARTTNINRTVSRERTLKGHTRDMSVNGLALMLPHIHLDGYHLAAEGRELHLNLELAGGRVPMVVVPRRYEKLDRAELGCNYLIGARIVRIEEEDRGRFEDFIRRGLEDHPPTHESDAN